MAIGVAILGVMSARLATVASEFLVFVVLLDVVVEVSLLRRHVDDPEIVVGHCSFDAKQTRQCSVHNCNHETRHRASTNMYSLTFLRSRFVARTPEEARSPGRPSNVENAPRNQSVSGQQRAQTAHSRPFALCRHIAGWMQACN